MNDSKDFQDAESVRSGNSHVTSQPGVLAKHPPHEGLLRLSFISQRYTDGQPNIWDTHGISGNVFANSPWKKTIEEPIHMSTAEKVEDQNEIKISDASLDRQSKIQSSSMEETIQRIMGQTNNDCRFLISTFDKFLSPATFACWKIRFKTDVCTCSQFPMEAMQWIE